MGSVRASSAVRSEPEPHNLSSDGTNPKRLTTNSANDYSGTLTVNGAPVQVTATIGSDGSVSGTLLNPDGSKYGVFSGRPSGARSMQGSFDLNGRVGDWTVPLRVPVPK